MLKRALLIGIPGGLIFVCLQWSIQRSYDSPESIAALSHWTTLTSLYAYALVIPAIIIYRKYDLNNKITWFKGFKIALLTTFFVSIILAMYAVLLFEYFHPGLPEILVQRWEQTTQGNPWLTPTEWAYEIRENNAFLNRHPLMHAWAPFINHLQTGAIVSAITAFILKKK